MVRYLPLLCDSFVSTAFSFLSLSVAVRICFSDRNGRYSCSWVMERLVQKRPFSSWCLFLVLSATKYAILA